MATRKGTAAMQAGGKDLAVRTGEALAALKRASSRSVRDGLARYAIPADRALGVPMGKIQAIAKTLGRDQVLADALWKTGVYEARMLCAYIDDPAQLTAARMDAYCRDFDNWATCDTLCFALFDRSDHAFARVHAWAAWKDEFQRRAAFALLASLALHRKGGDDAPFRAGLKLIEKHASDERNFVRKAVNWALRSIGGRNAALHAEAKAVASRLAASGDATARWNGKDALRAFAGPAMGKRLVAKAAKAEAAAAKKAKTAKTRSGIAKAAKPTQVEKAPAAASGKPRNTTARQARSRR